MADSYIRWRHSEWLQVAVNMLPRLEKGESNLVALANAMRKVIPKDRWQHDDYLAHATQPKRALGLLKSQLDKARALPEAERHALLVLTPAQRFALENPDAPKPVRKSPPKRGRLDEGREYKNHHRWTTLDKAKLARMIVWFQDHGVTAALSRMFIEAQELVLPREHRMSVRSIGVGTKRLPLYFAEGKANLWLLKDVPFNPPHPKDGEQAQEATETAISGDETASEYLTPPPPPHGAALGASVAPPPSLTEPLHVTTAAAVQQFGQTMMSALGALLSSHSQAVAHSFEARLAENASRMAAEVAGMVEAGMRKAVANMLAHELGGPVKANEVTSVAPPAPAAPRWHNPVPPSTDRPEQLKVDVVGFEIGSQESLVQSAFAGEVDLRFIHPDKMSAFAPHRGRHVVMMIGRVPHSLAEKFKAAKVEPIIVRRTPGHVIHAIEELQRSRGMSTAH